MKVKSRLGQGTEVSILLPRGNISSEASDAESKSGAGTVLLVEDNPDVASSSTLLLEELGYQVKWVADAESAVREIENDGINILFSDIVMPGSMNGLDLARLVKTMHPHMPIVLATEFSDAARKSGVEFPLLRKPYQLHELSEAFDRALYDTRLDVGRHH